jgi:hypothetical protein
MAFLAILTFDYTLFNGINSFPGPVLGESRVSAGRRFCDDDLFKHVISRSKRHVGKLCQLLKQLVLFLCCF